MPLFRAHHYAGRVLGAFCNPHNAPKGRLAPILMIDGTQKKILPFNCFRLRPECSAPECPVRAPKGLRLRRGPHHGTLHHEVSPPTTPRALGPNTAQAYGNGLFWFRMVLHNKVKANGSVVACGPLWGPLTGKAPKSSDEDV